MRKEDKVTSRTAYDSAYEVLQQALQANHQVSFSEVRRRFEDTPGLRFGPHMTTRDILQNMASWGWVSIRGDRVLLPRG